MKVEELSATLAAVIMKFEKEEMGVTPADVTVMIAGDLIVVHVKEVLSPSERILAQTATGQAVLQRFKKLLFEAGSNPSIREQVSQAVDRQVLEVQTSLSPLTGSLVVVLTLEPAKEHAC